MRVECPPCFWLQNKHKYLGVALLGHVVVSFIFHSQWEEIGTSLKQCMLLSWCLLQDKLVHSCSERLCFMLGPPGPFQSLGKYFFPSWKEGKWCAENYLLLFISNNNNMVWQFKMGKKWWLDKNTAEIYGDVCIGMIHSDQLNQGIIDNYYPL